MESLGEYFSSVCEVLGSTPRSWGTDKERKMEVTERISQADHKLNKAGW